LLPTDDGWIYGINRQNDDSMKIRLILLISFLFLIIHAYSQKISFFREDLGFRLSEEVFEVDGLYYFRNNTNLEVKQMLFYPFPDVEKFGEITYISVNKVNDTTPLVATQSKHGALFKLQIQPHGEVAYRIKYGQKNKGSTAKYIITTTQKWNKPFEVANYSLEFTGEIQLDSISIPPDSVAKTNESTRFYWSRRNFMPVCDFDFFFRK
jgi:hypothetical protein